MSSTSLLVCMDICIMHVSIIDVKFVLDCHVMACPFGHLWIIYMGSLHKKCDPSWKKVSKFKHVLELKKVYKPKVHISENSPKDWQFTKPSVSRIMEL